MDAFLSITNRPSVTQIPANEGKLKRLNTANGVSFESELDSAIKASANRKNPRDEKLWTACIEAESLFVGKMLKEMKSTVHKSEWLHGGYAEEIFEDMLYDEYAMNVSRNSNLGLAKMLYDELSRKM